MKTYREQIESLFARLPDKDIFTSLPGSGTKIASRLAAELGQDRNRFPDDMSLLCHAGVVPLTSASGKHRSVKIRWGCNKHLRNTVYLWSFLTLENCTWARAFYDQARQAGQNHATALRNLGRKPGLTLKQDTATSIAGLSSLMASSLSRRMLMGRIFRLWQSAYTMLARGRPRPTIMLLT